MIDTIIAKTDIPNHVLPDPDHWGEKDRRRQKINLDDGLVIGQNWSERMQRRYLKVQFEFPRLNGKSPRSIWQESRDVLQRVDGYIGNLFLGKLPPLTIWRVDRVDFCYDFYLPGIDLRNLLRTLNDTVENQRFSKVLYQNGESFYLRSKAKRPDLIRLYDKGEQMRAKKAEMEADDESEEEEDLFQNYSHTLRLEHQMIATSTRLRHIKKALGEPEWERIHVGDVSKPTFAYRALQVAMEELGLSDGVLRGVADARKILRGELDAGRISKARFNTLLGAYARCRVYSVEEWKAEMGVQWKGLRKDLKALRLWPPSDRTIEVPLRLPTLDDLSEPGLEWYERPFTLNFPAWEDLPPSVHERRKEEWRKNRRR